MGNNQQNKQVLIRKPILAALVFLGIWSVGWLFYIHADDPKVIVRKLPQRTESYVQIWTYSSVDQVLSAPVFMEDVIIYGTLNGKLKAISKNDGILKWGIDFKAPIFSLTANNDGTIFVGTGLHTDNQAILANVRADDGEIIWKISLFGHLEEPPLIDNAHHRLWAGLGPGGLWAIDTRDGSTIHSSSLGHIDTTPLLYDGKIFAPFQNGEDVTESTFYALNAETGKVVWKLPQHGQPWATPILNESKDKILTNTAIGQIGLTRTTDRGWAQAIDLSGKLIWEVELPGMALTPNIYVPDDHIMIYTCKNGYIIALNAETGQEIWKNKVADEINSEAIVLEPKNPKTLAVLSQNGVLQILDIESGSVIERISTFDGKSAGAPVVQGDILLVPTSFRVYALKEKWGESDEKK